MHDPGLSPDPPRDWYVYALADPSFGLFYIGKGKGARVFAHELENVADGSSTEKRAILARIRADGRTPIRFLVSGGLSDDEAYNLERILIEFCRGLEAAGVNPLLKNLASGRGSGAFMLRDEMIDWANPEPADFSNQRILLLSINGTYSFSTDYGKAVPNHVAGRWVLNVERASACEHIAACAQSRIVGVYTATRWVETTAGQDKRRRYSFEGEPSRDSFASSILGCRLPDGVGFGLGNPVLYGN